MIGDERRLYSEAIAATLNLVHDFEVVATVNNSREIVPTVLRTLPAVTVLGTNTTGRAGRCLADELRTAVPRCRIAVIGTSPGAPARRQEASAPGLLSVIPDNAALPQLVNAIRGLVANNPGNGAAQAAAAGPIDSAALLRQPPCNGRSLSTREKEVLRLTAGGAPVREIAAELFLSPGTVRNVTSSAIKKLGGRNRFDAACIASKRGWL
ncbi:helix-turn-helix transcriptional regulator [Streptomyces marispadix]|uniref:Response regulator transcription factor n=1 Tax=Streptomyces marispadix TaxID=2922868 RepID=A0ABS9SVS7_9ACTN|nr:response regulator transcription factor [Streptomyces marispadix]MCH6160374.1 response regulator transcription factor [Streptomyces marispadix]